MDRRRLDDPVRVVPVGRLDDDNVPEPGVLERLLLTADKYEDEKIGAVAGRVPVPGDRKPLPGLLRGKMSEIRYAPNAQWCDFDGILEVEHLYSTFIYRRSAASHGYCKQLSVVGHREETIFTHEMHRAGWKLLVDPRAVTWHFRWGSGGIRDEKRAELFALDEAVFNAKISEWNIDTREPAYVVLDNGLGDHYAFKHVIEEFKVKHASNRRILACCYPEVFSDIEGFEICSISDVNGLVDTEQHNVYANMWKTGRSGNLVSAYKNIYNCL